MEHRDQFLARMIVAVREGHQINSADAQRLNNLATFGADAGAPGDLTDVRTSMPEERRSGERIPAERDATDVVRG